MSINTTNNDNNTLLYQQLKVPQQIQIDRIKKQEDDEQWISGEELCTEGSSTDTDEDKEDTDIKQILQQQKLQLQFQHKYKYKQKKYNTNNINNKKKYKPSPLLNDSTSTLTSVISSNANRLTVEDQDDAGECSSWRWRPKQTEKLKKLERNFNNLRLENNLNKQKEAFINKKLNEIKLFDNKINKNHLYKLKLFILRIQTCQEFQNSIKLNAKNSQLFFALWSHDFAKYQEMQDNKKNNKCKKITINKRMNGKKQKQLTYSNNSILYKRKQYFIQTIINKNKKYLKECEDRRRLNQLLVEFSEQDHDYTKDNTNSEKVDDMDTISIVENVFSYDKELKEELDNINEKLKMYSASAAILEPSEILKNILNKRDIKCKNNNGTIKAATPNPRKNKLLTIRKQLNKIDQDLNVYNQKYLNSVISPLPDEKMSTLLQNSIGNATKKDENVNLSPDICRMLVEDAKNTIPKFKYKYTRIIDDDESQIKIKKNIINSSINKTNNQHNQREHDIIAINECYEQLFPNK